MLINSNTKTRYSEILTDTILHFFRLAQEKELLNLIATCTKDQNSKEFKQLRTMLVSMFSSRLDERELALVFNEIKTLVSETGSSQRN